MVFAGSGLFWRTCYSIISVRSHNKPVRLLTTQGVGGARNALLVVEEPLELASAKVLEASRTAELVTVD